MTHFWGDTSIFMVFERAQERQHGCAELSICTQRSPSWGAFLLSGRLVMVGYFSYIVNPLIFIRPEKFK